MLMICETKIDDDFSNGQLQKKVLTRHSDLIGIKMVVI